MNISDERIFQLIVDIMDISNEPENIQELENWVTREGIDTVLRKIVLLHTTFGDK